MPEGAPKTSDEVVDYIATTGLVCVLDALAMLSENGQGVTRPLGCEGCSILAKNDRDGITHVLKPGLCDETEYSIYRHETFLEDLDRVAPLR